MRTHSQLSSSVCLEISFRDPSGARNWSLGEGIGQGSL